VVYIDLFITPDWSDYLIIEATKLVYLGMIYIYCYQNQELNLISFVLNGLKISMLYIFVFALFEKVKKEQFVLNYTNTKTRKILL
jgi:hypothetical protein